MDNEDEQVWSLDFKKNAFQQKKNMNLSSEDCFVDNFPIPFRYPLNLTKLVT